MGNFYTNYTLRGPSQQAVGSVLAGRSAIVTPELNGSVVVYDEESDSQDTEVITQLGKQLSKALDCVVLAVLNHDDDILCYELYEGGTVIDEYCSVPGYFSGEDTPPSGGDAQKLCTAFGSANVKEVQAILHPPGEDLPTFAVEQHQALADALGTPAYAAGFGFNYVSTGEVPEGLSDADLLKIP